MKLEEAIKEVMKDSPPNAAIRKCDLERAVSLMQAPAPAAPAASEPEKPAADAPPPQA